MAEVMRRFSAPGILFALAALAIAVGFLVPPIPQDPAYHDFADQRTLYGIPHFWNVVSNLPFLLVGMLGVLRLAGRRVAGGLPELHTAYSVFFIGVFLTGLGSAWYHLGPTNETLFWDRLPMTLSFMAFFSAMVGENLSPRAGRRLLWPLVITGLLSIIYWHITETRGQGDLRPYAMVQFLPFILIPAILVLSRSRLTGNGYLWGVIAAYAASKLLEALDAPAYSVLGGTSGHALKHVMAALGAWLFYLALSRRVIREASPGQPGQISRARRKSTHNPV